MNELTNDQLLSITGGFGNGTEPLSVRNGTMIGAATGGTVGFALGGIVGAPVGVVMGAGAGAGAGWIAEGYRRYRASRGMK